jgi:D-alanyl-lipoteichoic acid acyltransferase DltB (MBOAT superfamily)
LFGIELMENFRAPYFARNMQDFWRRWHISLSTWLRDYLYIPLGGSRTSRSRTYRNLALTMLLGGLWHGAGWGFLLWGAFHGVWLALHRALFRDRFVIRVPAALSVVLTFHGVCAAWVLFRAESLADSLLVYRGLVNFATPVVPVSPMVLMIVAVGFASHLLGASRRLAEAWAAKGFDVQAGYWFAVVVGVLLLSSETAQFIYFQF